MTRTETQNENHRCRGMSSILVTGANRGLGLGLVQQLLNGPSPAKHIFATCRNPAEAKELERLKEAHSKLYILSLDITNFDSFDAFASEIAEITQDAGLNVLVNNAGVTKKTSNIEAIETSTLLETFQTNAMGTVLLTKALLPLLQKASKFNGMHPYGCDRAAIINISSIRASIGANDDGGSYVYRMSKAAVNAATKSFSIDLADDKILCVALHPGWVQTEMGGSSAPMTIADSARQIVNTISGLNESHNGTFIQYDGKQLEW